VTADELRQYVRDIPDFPKPGIVFKDITPLLADARALRAAVDIISAPYAGRVDAVVGIESRGFVFGAPVAYCLGAGLIIARKAGKLPFRTISETYELEYGNGALEIHIDGVASGRRVLIVDDLLATGGTAAAAVRLVERLGVRVIGCAFLVELGFLKGRERLAPVECFSAIRYDSD
jgi:adenine phosphoribosyltransferase